jgi:hypothetical protein
LGRSDFSLAGQPRVSIISTHDGHQIFTAQSHRYSVDLSPAIDPIDIGINSVLTLIDLRDLRLARAEYEVGREIVMRLPTAQLNISNLQKAAVQNERALDAESAARTTSQLAAHRAPKLHILPIVPDYLPRQKIAKTSYAAAP